MYARIHHVAVAVSNLEEVSQLFTDVLGLELQGVEEVPTEKSRVAFFPVGESSFELVAPTEGGTSLGQFLDKRGNGLHHICLEVDDIDAAVVQLRDKGVKFTAEAPKPGAHGARIIFIHPRSAGGILLELRQGPPGEVSHG